MAPAWDLGLYSISFSGTQNQVILNWPQRPCPLMSKVAYSGDTATAGMGKCVSTSACVSEGAGEYSVVLPGCGQCESDQTRGNHELGVGEEKHPKDDI